MATTVSPGSEKCLADSPVVQPMDSFRVLNESEVQKLIEVTPKKSCSLDPMPTPVVVGCINILLPVITKVINLSTDGLICWSMEVCFSSFFAEEAWTWLGFSEFVDQSAICSTSLSSPSRLYLVKRTSTWSSMKSILICNRLIVNITALKRPNSKSWTTSS